MVIGNQNDNYTYYDGYDGEPEIILSIENVESLHIWEGYFDDIFDSPPLDGNGWEGFTRDYNQLDGAFSEECDESFIEPQEYLKDMLRYREKKFDFTETTDVFTLLASLLEKAIDMNVKIKVQRS